MNEKITFDAKMTLLPSMLRWIRDRISHIPFSNAEKNKLEIACEEILVNIIHYAYENNGGKLEIDWTEKNGFISITFRDHGQPFNPLENQKPVIKTQSLESKEIGGLGIYFIKQFVDKVDYSFSDQTNVLTITKKVRLRKAI